jgi:hypothetical protein
MTLCVYSIGYYILCIELIELAFILSNKETNKNIAFEILNSLGKSFSIVYSLNY